METTNLSGATGSLKDTNVVKSETRTKAKRYAQAELSMLIGKRIIIAGVAISLIGVISYCIICFSTTSDQRFGEMLLDNPLIPSLAIIGLGTLAWLIGSFVHLKGAMESDPEKTDISL